MKKLKKLFALSLAVAMFVCAMAFPASAANCKSGTVYGDFREGSNATNAVGTFNVYTGGLSGTVRPLYGMVTPNTKGYTSTVYVWFTYYSLEYGSTISGPIGAATATDSYARAYVNCDYDDYFDFVDARARFWIEDKTTLELVGYGQVCAHYNDDTAAECEDGAECKFNNTDYWFIDKN